eukprot:scaffold38801_cov19-Tisochrysis_lutea.AAC.2
MSELKYTSEMVGHTISLLPKEKDRGASRRALFYSCKAVLPVTFDAQDDAQDVQHALFKCTHTH